MRALVSLKHSKHLEASWIHKTFFTNMNNPVPSDEDESSTEQEASSLIPINVDESSTEQEAPATITCGWALLYAFFWVLMNTLSDNLPRIVLYAFGFPPFCIKIGVGSLQTYLISLFLGALPLWDFFVSVLNEARKIHRLGYTVHLSDRFRVSRRLGFTPTEFLAEGRRKKFVWFLRGVISFICLCFALFAPSVSAWFFGLLPPSGNVTIPFIPVVPVAPPHRGA